MSDFLQHECGIAMLRLKKPLQHYVDKYGTPFYGLNKMYLLMEKQHNRGQDGAGLANIKLDVNPGKRYISRMRSVDARPIQDLFGKIMGRFQDLSAEQLQDTVSLQHDHAFTGELFLGHLRYGTFGKNEIENCHPFLRQNNWRTRNLVVAGNFNLTNVDELFDVLVQIGQHPKQKSDTVTVLEKIGHFVDEANQELFDQLKGQGLDNQTISERIADTLDMGSILRRASSDFDGGYVMCGMLGHGDAFVMRDPNGIRPAYWYEDDEVVVAASERPVIQTAFNVPAESIQEVAPGGALLIRRSGETLVEEIRPAGERKACSFERIYFSRGNDGDIYNERKALGSSIVPRVLEAVEHDLDHTVTSFIPNTAESSFYGLVKGLEEHLNASKIARIKGLGADPDHAEIESILNERPRIDKIAIKDAKLRTFITEDSSRDDLVAHVYDITYGTVEPGVDNLGGDRRQHRARHHAEEEHPPNPGPPPAQADRGGVQRAPNPLPRLLRHRHGAHGGLHRVPSGGVLAQGARHGARVGRHLQGVQAPAHLAFGGKRQPSQGHLRALHRRGNQRPHQRPADP